MEKEQPPQSRELIPQSPPSAFEEDNHPARPYSANVRDRPRSAKPAPPAHFDFDSSDEQPQER